MTTVRYDDAVGEVVSGIAEASQDVAEAIGMESALKEVQDAADQLVAATGRVESLAALYRSTVTSRDAAIAAEQALAVRESEVAAELDALRVAYNVAQSAYDDAVAAYQLATG